MALLRQFERKTLILEIIDLLDQEVHSKVLLNINAADAAKYNETAEVINYDWNKTYTRIRGCVLN